MSVVITDAIGGVGKPVTDPFEALAVACTFSARDWGADREDAWLYGIVAGWGPALPDVAARHGWTPETVERLRKLRAVYARRVRAIRREAGRR